LTGFDFDERDLFKIARIEHNMIENQVLESNIGEAAVDVDHVLYLLIELHVRVTNIHQGRCFEFEVLTFEIFYVFRKPERKPVVHM
jgi:hypothetical protein